jgi:hypothetical protein
MMRVPLQARRWQVFTALAMLVCLLALLIPHAGSHVTFVACVLFFPVFLFGLLDPQQWLGATERANEMLLPQSPCLSVLFQRPPPSIV